MKKFPTFLSVLKIPLDFLLIVFALISAYELRFITDLGLGKPLDYEIVPPASSVFQKSLIAASAFIIISAIRRSYNIRQNLKLGREIKESIINWTLWIMAIMAYYFLTRNLPYSRLAIFYSWGIAATFIILGRIILKLIQDIFHHFGIGKTHLLFIGDNAITKELSKHLSKNPNYKIIGTANTGEEFFQTVEKYDVEEIIQTKEHLTDVNDEEVLEYCELNHVSYRFVPDLLEVRRTNINIETLCGIPIIAVKPTPLEGWGKVIKRLTDILAATFGLILLSPIFLLTAIAIKIDSRGPVFFTKLDDGSPAYRIGQKGKKFLCYKFRSMHPNTHNQRYKELAHKNTRTGPLVKIKEDPRVTRVGKFIRKYSIDELPQLYNVLIGNMSLVGPRPHLPEEVANYQKHHHFILTIKPGLSGLAQISGRSDLTFEEEVKLDRYYIENWSIFLDIKIIFKTVLVVLKGHKE